MRTHMFNWGHLTTTTTTSTTTTTTRFTQAHNTLTVNSGIMLFFKYALNYVLLLMKSNICFPTYAGVEHSARFVE